MSQTLPWLCPMCLFTVLKVFVKWEWGLQCDPKAKGLHVSSQLCRRASAKGLTFQPIPIKIPFSPTSFSSIELKSQYH